MEQQRLQDPQQCLAASLVSSGYLQGGAEPREGDLLLGAYEAMDGYVDDVLACVVKVSEDDPRYPELRKGLLPLLRSGCKVEGRAATLRRIVAAVASVARQLLDADPAVRQAALQRLRALCEACLTHQRRVMGLFGSGLVVGIAAILLIAHQAADAMLKDQSRLSGESVNLFKAVKRLAAGSSLWEPLLRQQARSERRFYVQKLSEENFLSGTETAIAAFLHDYANENPVDVLKELVAAYLEQKQGALTYPLVQLLGTDGLEMAMVVCDAEGRLPAGLLHNVLEDQASYSPALYNMVQQICRVIAPLFRDLVRLYRATGRAVPRELQAACITLTLAAKVLDPAGSGGKVAELLDSTLADLMGNMTSDVSGLKEEVAEVKAQLGQHQAATQTTVEGLRAEVQGMQQALQAALQLLFKMSSERNAAQQPAAPTSQQLESNVQLLPDGSLQLLAIAEPSGSPHGAGTPLSGEGPSSVFNNAMFEGDPAGLDALTLQLSGMSIEAARPVPEAAGVSLSPPRSRVPPPGGLPAVQPAERPAGQGRGGSQAVRPDAAGRGGGASQQRTGGRAGGTSQPQQGQRAPPGRMGPAWRGGRAPTGREGPAGHSGGRGQGPQAPRGRGGRGSSH